MGDIVGALVGIFPSSSTSSLTVGEIDGECDGELFDAFEGDVVEGDAFEGGHRVPFIIRYPNHVKPGTTSNATTTLANLLATTADIVGIYSQKYKPEDSYSILPILLGKSTLVENQPAIVNISSIGFYSIRKGPWKLVTKLGSGGFTAPKEISPKAGEPIGQLYNLDTDIHEDNNLYQQYPEKVKELTELLEKIKNLKK